ncbi:chromosomal replication initiator protein DnaA [Lentisphaerota bacterium WC36G]|nr:chromosomal replication initiator protein DnaA [Lentisphaerae bacterium WC36]
MQNTQQPVVDIWQATCKILREKMHEASYNQWIKVIVPIELKNEDLTLGVSDSFFGDWLITNFGEMITESLKNVTGKELKLNIEIGHNPVVDEEELAINYSIEDDELTLVDIKDEKKAIVKEEKPISIEERSARINCLSRHSFENFVVGEENRYAFAAASTAAKSPGVYNPLYIYGGTGLGKTHLMQAVALEISNNNPNAKILYITCEALLNRYVDAIRQGKHAEFRNEFRNVDVLLVDDVHQLSNKFRLQEEFFNMFNTLYNESKQIILTSDKEPSEITGLEERLISRFESGVTTQIIYPGFETRLAILKAKQEDHLVKLSEDVLQFIAQRISASVRRLEGALLRLVAYSSMMSDCPISLEKAEDLLVNLLEKEAANRAISIERIQKYVADYFEISVNDILSVKRPKNIAEPRMVAMYLARRLTEHSYPEIGEAFRKNHATVMHAEKKVGKKCTDDEVFMRTISMIERQLQQKNAQ